MNAPPRDTQLGRGGGQPMLPCKLLRVSEMLPDLARGHAIGATRSEPNQPSFQPCSGLHRLQQLLDRKQRLDGPRSTQDDRDYQSYRGWL